MEKYKVVNGTSYHIDTNDEIIDVLEKVRQIRTRIILDYGDIKTGRSWGDRYDITGYVGRSTGYSKIPLLIHNTRSMGGGGILTHCIIGIKTSKGKIPLYKWNK